MPGSGSPHRAEAAEAQHRCREIVVKAQAEALGEEAATGTSSVMDRRSMALELQQQQNHPAHAAEEASLEQQQQHPIAVQTRHSPIAMRPGRTIVQKEEAGMAETGGCHVAAGAVPWHYRSHGDHAKGDRIVDAAAQESTPLLHQVTLHTEAP